MASSPIRTPHLFSQKSPGSKEKYNGASLNSKRDRYSSYYASPSRKDKSTDPLDIRKIDHEAIRNDPELKQLSRNPSAFNNKLLDDEFDEEDDEAFYESDEDNDVYAELEKLVHDPEEERRLRLESQASTVSNQNVPGTPRYSSFFSSQESEPNRTRTQTKQRRNIDNHWKDSLKSLLFMGIKAFVFIIFMAYWIIKEPIIRSVAFFTMAVSTLIVDPLLKFWSILPNNENWNPSAEKRKQITAFFTALSSLLLVIMIWPAVSPHLPELFTNSVDTVKSYTTFQNQGLQPALAADISSFMKSYNSEQAKLWSAVTELRGEKDKRDQTIAELKLDTKENSHMLLEAQKDISDIKAKIQEHEQQIDTLKKTIHQEVKDAIGSQLPEMILVHTNKDGEFELSPQFYNYLQSPAFYSEFMQRNQESIEKYLSGEMTEFFQQQEKRGAIINKEAFMKLLSNSLLVHKGENDDISLDMLVESALNKYHQDVLNTPDFALASRGARVIHTMTSATYHHVPAWLQSLRHLAGLSVTVNPPELALSPQTRPGECWTMKGYSGTLAVALSERIMIKAITVEYPSAKVMMHSIEHAPRKMNVYGLTNYPKDTLNRMLLGTIEYDISKESSIQTFDLDVNPLDNFNAVVIKFESNWGSPHHTDIYRVRVHGVPV